MDLIAARTQRDFFHVIPDLSLQCLEVTVVTDGLRPKHLPPPRSLSRDPNTSLAPPGTPPPLTSAERSLQEFDVEETARMLAEANTSLEDVLVRVRDSRTGQWSEGRICRGTARRLTEDDWIRNGKASC